MSLRTFPIFIALFVCALIIPTAPAECQVVTDTFVTPHDYSGGNVAGTIWSGVLNSSNLALGNADVTNPGQLTWSSTPNSGWENALANSPTLYLLVAGNFDESVHVTGMTTTFYSDGGLIARAPALSDAEPGENYLALRYFAPYGFNSVRNTYGSVTTNQNLPGLEPYLRMTRTGSTFQFYTKENAGDPWTLEDTLVRPDLGAVTDLEVGLWFGTFSSAAGAVQFDNFSLQGNVVGAVPEPGAISLLAAFAVSGPLLWKRRRSRADNTTKRAA